MLLSSGESGPPCGTPSSVLTTTPSGITTLALSIRRISASSRRSCTLCSSRASKRSLVDSVEEVLQVQVDDPLVPVLQISLRLGDGRVTAPSRPEAMAARVEGRLVVRAEHLVHGLLDTPVDHIRECQGRAARRPPWGSTPGGSSPGGRSRRAARGAAPAGARPRCSRTSSIALAVRAGRPVVLCHLLETPLSGFHRSPPPPSSSPAGSSPACFSTSAPRAGSRAGRPVSAPATAPCGLSAVSGNSSSWPACSLAVVAFPPRVLARGWDRLSTAFRYYATIRLLSSLRHLVLGSSMTTAACHAEAERSPRVRTQNFVPTPSPIRPPARRIWASLPSASSPQVWTPLTALRFRSVRHCTRLPPDAPSRVVRSLRTPLSR